MDIILTPTKLNGTIHSRPSAVSVCLHGAARRIALISDPSNTFAEPVCDSGDRLTRIEMDPADMDAIIGSLDCLAKGSERIDCCKSNAALLLTLPIAAAVRETVAFVGASGSDFSETEPVCKEMERYGMRFSKGSLKIKRRERSRIEEIFTMSGHLRYGHISLNGKEDPRFIAGLLFALPLLEGNSTIRMTTLPESTELADMTVNVLKQYGIDINASVNEYGYPHYEIPGSQRYSIPNDPVIEGDWAAASFWLGCGALGGNITVHGLDPDSLQSSRQILDKLHTMGAAAGMGEDGANVTAASLTGCNINAGHIPYLIPVLSVCLASSSGPSALTDVDPASMNSVAGILDALGAKATAEGSTLRFESKPVFSGGDCGHDTDPIAILTAAAASCVCSESVLIRNAGAINKYYPGFFDEFESLGGRIRILP